MKLNHDLVRYVLLSIESSNQVSGPTEDELMMEVKKYGSYSKDDIMYTVSKLEEAGFITGEIHYAKYKEKLKPMWMEPGNLTYEGHKFLDNVRDDGVWKHTKATVAKVGNASLSIISTVAANYISDILGL